MIDDLDVGRDCSQLRRDLETRRRHAVEDLQRCLARIRQAEMRAPDSETWEEDASDIDVGLVDILNATVHRIDAALRRLDDGAYGHCVRCRRRISDMRLRALPFAVRCHPCEAERERERLAQRGGRRAARWNEDGATPEHEDR